MPGLTYSRMDFGNFMQGLRSRAPHPTLLSAATHLDVSRWVLQRLEEGTPTKLTRPQIESLIQFYEPTPEEADKALEIWADIREQDKAARAQGNSRGFWKAHVDRVAPHFEKFLRLEGVANEIRTFEPVIVPGLLQVPEYRAGMIRTNDPAMSAVDVERLLALLANRQARLDDKSLQLDVFLSEATLRNRMGSAEVMSAQLRGLMATGERDNVSVRVVPFSVGPHRGLTVQACTLLSFPTGDSGMVLPSVVYAEGFLGSVFHEHDDEVNTYRSALADLQEVALSEQDTRDLVSRVAKEYAA